MSTESTIKPITKKKKKSGVTARGSRLADLMAEEFDKGKKLARDPQNAHLPPLDLRVTNHDSAWFALSCLHCEFNFRLEDRVRACPHCDFAMHEDERFGLKCWSEFFGNNAHCPKCEREILFSGENQSGKKTAGKRESASSKLAQNIFEQFTEGLKKEWTIFGEDTSDVESRVVEHKSDKAYKKPCMICGEGIRLGDRYVESPCGCGSYFHSDMLRHLTCWNIRFTMSSTNYCILSGKLCPVVLKAP